MYVFATPIFIGIKYDLRDQIFNPAVTYSTFPYISIFYSFLLRAVPSLFFQMRGCTPGSVSLYFAECCILCLIFVVGNLH